MNPLGTDLMGFVRAILGFVIQLGTVVIIFMVVYVGFLFVKARGNPGELEDARRALMWTVIGALVLLGSQAIATAISDTVKAISG